jgi:DNA-binding transcriptional LysR family regulator
MAALPDLEAWAIFARVAEHGSFTAAAAELGLSKATVSKAVGRLEARLGAPLFHRSSRRLALTPSGESMAERAAAMLADAEALEDAARDDAGSPHGLVRIAAPMSFGTAFLAPALPELMAACPKLSIEVDLSDARVDLVAAGIDIALRIGALEDSSLKARRLAEIPSSVVAAPAYWDAHGRPEHPSELARHNCFRYTNLPSRSALLFHGPAGEPAPVRLSGSLAINNGEAMLPAARAGLGVAILPRFIVAEDLAAGRLEAVMADWSPFKIALQLVTPPGRVRPARVTAVIDFLVARLHHSVG